MTNAEMFMRRALALAAQAYATAAPNPMVGCVLVQQDQVVGEGYHQQYGGPHAEVFALQQAGVRARGATAYVTLEPCSHFGRTPPCIDALIAAQVGQVVVAMQDPNPLVSGRGIAALRAAGIPVEVGLLATEAAALNAGFVSRMQRQRPWLRVKLAASIDGRTALANGASQWLTSTAARQDVQQQRARSQAILSTAATVMADDAQLTVRTGNTALQPLRVILDREARLRPQQRLFQVEGGAILLVYGEQTVKPVVDWPSHVRWCQVPVHDGQLALAPLLQYLAQQEQINQVWTECGATLAGSLIRQQLADELIVYLAPKLLGPQAQPLLQLPLLEQLSAAPALAFTDVQQLGPDLRVTARCCYDGGVQVVDQEGSEKA